MILTSPELDSKEILRRTGWEIKPEGACRDDVCVPLGANPDLATFAQRLGMPLLHDEAHGLWCLGPPAGGRALASAVFPELVLPDRYGVDFDFRSLRGQKVFLLAWASW